MQQKYIDFLKGLDEEGMYGNIQSVLMRVDLSVIPFDQVAMHLLTLVCRERKELVRQNANMLTVMEQHGIANSLNVLGRSDD